MITVYFNKDCVVESLNPDGTVEKVHYAPNEGEFIHNIAEQPDNRLKLQVYDGSLLFNVRKEDIAFDTESSLTLNDLVRLNVFASTHSNKFLIGRLEKEGNYFSFGTNEELYLEEQIKEFGEV